MSYLIYSACHDTAFLLQQWLYKHACVTYDIMLIISVWKRGMH